MFTKNKANSIYKGNFLFEIYLLITITLFFVLVYSNVNFTGFFILDLQNISSDYDINNQNYSQDTLSFHDSCYTPYENMLISSDTNICYGIYNFSDSSNSGVIQIVNDNIHLNCNGANFFNSQYNENSIGINSSYVNITIENCNFYDYGYGIFLKANKYYNSGNYTVINNTVYNAYKEGIYLNGLGKFAYNNTISCYRNSSKIIGRDGLHFGGSSSYGIIKYNKIIGGCDVGILVGYNSDFVEIINNNIANNDEGIRISNSDNINIIGNNIINNSNDIDNYDTAIRLVSIREYNRSSNIYIYKNNLTDLTSNSILIQNYYNVTIDSNNISFVNFLNRNQYLALDNLDPYCAFWISPYYKGWDTSTDNMDLYKDTILNTSLGVSDLIVIKNNRLSNSQCYIYSIGTSNLFHDFNNYWYRSFQYPYLLNKTEMWLNPYYDKLERWNGKIFSVLAYKYGNPIPGEYFNVLFNYVISKTNQTFKNNHWDNKPVELHFLNLSLAAPYNDVYDNTNKVLLANNVENYKMILQPNQEVIISNYSNAPTYCGDNTCNVNESELTCPQDCYVPITIPVTQPSTPTSSGGGGGGSGGGGFAKSAIQNTANKIINITEDVKDQNLTDELNGLLNLKKDEPIKEEKATEFKVNKEVALNTSLFSLVILAFIGLYLFYKNKKNN